MRSMRGRSRCSQEMRAIFRSNGNLSFADVVNQAQHMIEKFHPLRRQERGNGDLDIYLQRQIGHEWAGDVGTVWLR